MTKDDLLLDLEVAADGLFDADTDDILYSTLAPPTYRFCLLDTNVTETTERLDDAMVLQLIMLYQLTDITHAQTCQVFDIDPVELHAYLHPWAGSGKSLAQLFVEALDLHDEDDEELLHGIAVGCAIKADESLETGENYVDMTYSNTIALAAAVCREDPRMVGLASMQELQEVARRYAACENGTQELLKRAAEGGGDGN